MKRFIFFQLNNSLDVAWYISERYWLKRFWQKGFQCIRALMLCFSFIFFANMFFNIPYVAKFRLRKVTTRSGEHFTWFCCFILELLHATVASLQSLLIYLDSRFTLIYLDKGSHRYNTHEGVQRIKLANFHSKSSLNLTALADLTSQKKNWICLPKKLLEKVIFQPRY